jgi:hypothetical protein
MKFKKDVAGIRVDSPWSDPVYLHGASTEEEAIQKFAEYLVEGLDEIVRNLKSDYLDSQLAHRSFGSLDLAKRNNVLADKVDHLEKHMGLLRRELQDKDALIQWLEKRIEKLGACDMNTCDACKHYTPSRFPSHMPEYKDCGECALTDLPWPDGTSNWQVAEDKLASWDVGDAGSGIYVGPKFGCIHWEKKS